MDEFLVPLVNATHTANHLVRDGVWSEFFPTERTVSATCFGRCQPASSYAERAPSSHKGGATHSA